MLAKYELLNLSEAAGLMLDDIDLSQEFPAIEIRPNALRDHLKRPARERRQPIHPELLRLGFLDYCAELLRLNFKTVFPDLILRGQNTDLGDLFAKKWAPALDSALPTARENQMTLHSWRKDGNTFLTSKEPEVSRVTRYQLLGHTLTDPNGRHYTDPMPDTVKLAALQLLPNVTAHLKPAKIRLAQAVLDFARDVPLEKRTFLI